MSEEFCQQPAVLREIMRSVELEISPMTTGNRWSFEMDSGQRILAKASEMPMDCGRVMHVRSIGRPQQLVDANFAAEIALDWGWWTYEPGSFAIDPGALRAWAPGLAFLLNISDSLLRESAEEGRRERRAEYDAERVAIETERRALNAQRL